MFISLWALIPWCFDSCPPATMANEVPDDMIHRETDRLVDRRRSAKPEIGMIAFLPDRQTGQIRSLNQTGLDPESLSRPDRRDTGEGDPNMFAR